MIVSLSCEEASRLASESLDRELTRNERWGLRVHAMVCRNCRRLMRQLELLRIVAAKLPESACLAIRESLPQISPDRKARIKQLLSDAQRTDRH